MENINLTKNSRIIKIANNKKKKKINELLKIKDEMINNNIDEQIIKKYIDEQYININFIYEKSINKKIDINIIMNKKRNNALEFLIKNKKFLEENNIDSEYIKEYVKKQYEDLNKTYMITDKFGFID